ncbi:hypothetical protein IRJ41_005713 [Triplophysa rosa]|uniref:Uncharacterized protein n=1 Tax=Triplophysa rosa TaxID=992332 RepID=A0A9W7T773_TRIRA|nr:hypothetical protein IRJ41_005713 [Triplophysa rosa]
MRQHLFVPTPLRSKRTLFTLVSCQTGVPDLHINLSCCHGDAGSSEVRECLS